MKSSSGARLKVLPTRITFLWRSGLTNRMSSRIRGFSTRNCLFNKGLMIFSSRSSRICWYSMMPCVRISIIRCLAGIKTRFWLMLRVMVEKRHHLPQNKGSKGNKVRPKRLMKIKKMQTSRKRQKRTSLNSTDWLMSSEPSNTTPKSSPETVTEWAHNTSSTSTTNSTAWTNKTQSPIPAGFTSAPRKLPYLDSKLKRIRLFSTLTFWII